jgi:hypothetical protein
VGFGFCFRLGGITLVLPLGTVCLAFCCGDLYDLTKIRNFSLPLYVYQWNIPGMKFKNNSWWPSVTIASIFTK